MVGAPRHTLCSPTGTRGLELQPKAPRVGAGKGWAARTGVGAGVSVPALSPRPTPSQQCDFGQGASPPGAAPEGTRASSVPSVRERLKWCWHCQQHRVLGATPLPEWGGWGAEAGTVVAPEQGPAAEGPTPGGPGQAAPPRPRGSRDGADRAAPLQPRGELGLPPRTRAARPARSPVGPSVSATLTPSSAPNGRHYRPQLTSPAAAAAAAAAATAAARDLARLRSPRAPRRSPALPRPARTDPGLE